MAEKAKGKNDTLSQLAKILENEGQCAICRTCFRNPVTYVIPIRRFSSPILTLSQSG
jgi:hypothetical protein